MKWGQILNIDTIIAICIFIAVVYCLLTTKRKPGKYKFQGLGDGSFTPTKTNTSPGFWNYGKSSQKKAKKFYKHEEKCRKIFEKIYGHKFKSVRPDWLKNPVSGRNLELDGFCPKIRTPIGTGLAFEYDGEQHSKYNKRFHKHGSQEFLYQCKKDSWKDLRCKQEGVTLIRIPHHVAYEDLERYITNILDKRKLLPRDHRRSGSFAYTPRSQDEEYEESVRSQSLNSTRFAWKENNGIGFLTGLYR